MAGASVAHPGWGSWSPDVSLWLLVITGAMYMLGSARTVTPASRARSQRLRDVAFWAALATLAIGLDSPIDAFSEQLFWVHMVQHVLLMLVAAPLLVLAAPWLRLWRALPLGLRRSVARGLAGGRWAAPLRAAARWLGAPLPALAFFTVVLLGWHVPALFDATLRSGAVHALEHLMFVFAAVLLFKQVIDSPPLHARLGDAQRVLYMTAAMTVSWVLAVWLAIAPDPLYSHYAQLASRPSGISALGDQQLAAGVMWVPGSVPFLLVILVYVHRWLTPATPNKSTAPRLAAGPWEG
ncbi:MAG TPA: cytochrome c oxidase assembly protein [Solirubrobacteraceae bacterium]|jgi:putative membrane protein|nr:cytochrome c oxidase assembly protein [Solirubrobacteraceae bacterium]